MPHTRHMVGRDPVTGGRFIPACGTTGAYRPRTTSTLTSVTCKLCLDGITRKDPTVLARMAAALGKTVTPPPPDDGDGGAQEQLPL